MEESEEVNGGKWNYRCLTSSQCAAIISGEEDEINLKAVAKPSFPTNTV